MQTKEGNKVNNLALVVIFFMLFSISLPSSAWAEYTYIEIIPSDWHGAGRPNGVNAINNGGDIVGEAEDAKGRQKGYLYSGGKYTEIIPPGWMDAYASDINDNGDIVGSGNDGGSNKGFLYSGGKYTEIIPPEWFQAGAYAINNSGDIVGGGWDTNGYTKGFLYSGGKYTEIIPPEWYGAGARAINNSGDIAGSSWTVAYQEWDIFLYSGGRYTTLFISGAVLEGTDASDINDNGDIVGWIDDRPNYNKSGFLWNGEVDFPPTYTRFIPPGWDYASANAINNNGDIVGEGYDLYDLSTKGFLYSGGKYTEIIPPGWLDAYAYDINDNGDIVGRGIDANGVVKGFLATLMSVCLNWTDVIGKYNAYVSGSATWNDVITCYTEYTSPE